MTELLTSGQMRGIERAAIEAGSVTGLGMMRRAAEGVVRAVCEAWPDLAAAPHHAVVLCGPGNNGGDGFGVAKGLRDLGWTVETFFFGTAERLSEDARAMHDAWAQVGQVLPMTAERAGQGTRPSLLVDAIFGTGLTRPIPIVCALAIQAVIQRKGAPDGPMRIVAVDAPSGVDMDSGVYLRPEELAIKGDVQGAGPVPQSPAFRDPPDYDLCVTFHRPKRGHYLRQLARAKPVVVDIGLPVDPVVTEEGSPVSPPQILDRVRLVDPGSRAARHEWLRDVAYVGTGGHKYERGHVLVLGGGVGRGGAARLAARAALRIGAGLVTLAVPPAAVLENATQLNAIMLRPLRDDAALREMLRDDRLSAVVVGPGLGVGDRTRALVLAALEGERRVVLDADALSSFADRPEDLFAALHDRAVLTPHEGEFARLFPDLSEGRRQPDPAACPLSKIDAAKRAAARCGATVLLKGEATVIASPDGTTGVHAALYDRSAPWLGTAGAGDVLAGMIGGVLAHPEAAQGIHHGVEAAAWLHVECARSFGPGLIAEDLPDQLPRVFRELGF